MSFPGDDNRRGGPSDALSSLDLSGNIGPSPRPGWASLSKKVKIPASWVGMSGYVVAGIFLGFVVILALSMVRGDATAAPPHSRMAITDNVVRLHSHDIGNSCWQGFERLGPARLTVALEVGVDGTIRYAAASGETSAMRGCVEAHVKLWEFLPQSKAQTMALPFQVDRR